MTTGTFTFYQSFPQYAMDGTIDLNTDTFKVLLTTSAYTPNASTHTVKANVTNELATANGYTAGGGTLTSVTWNKSGAITTFDAANFVWTASGGSIGPARYAVLYKSGTANSITDPLVGYMLLDNTPADVTVTDTNTLTANFNASGIFTLTIV